MVSEEHGGHADATEVSVCRQPFETRDSSQKRLFANNGAANDRVTAAGVGAYYSKQNWVLTERLMGGRSQAIGNSRSGSGFRSLASSTAGAVAGLGAGASRSVLFSGPPLLPTSSLLPLENVGGWSAQIQTAGRRRFAVFRNL
jgi:hypothetical protein